ncbi:MAG: hypothetical protein NZ988_01180 [Thaumarchaeota archaeon]|nr:hypothetical protein [Candidatus Calditenuaceae archaeon]MDW8186646.1 hypothetical protein [Nitrososphaerota archaeon]
MYWSILVPTSKFLKSVLAVSLVWKSAFSLISEWSRWRTSSLSRGSVLMTNSSWTHRAVLRRAVLRRRSSMFFFRSRNVSTSRRRLAILTLMADLRPYGGLHQSQMSEVHVDNVCDYSAV